jgi:hypothetical protein
MIDRLGEKALVEFVEFLDCHKKSKWCIRDQPNGREVNKDKSEAKDVVRRIRTRTKG